MKDRVQYCSGRRPFLVGIGLSISLCPGVLSLSVWKFPFNPQKGVLSFSAMTLNNQPHCQGGWWEMAKMKTKRASGVDAGLIWLVGPAQTWLSRFELYELADPKLVQYNLIVWKYTFKWVAYVCDRLFNGTHITLQWWRWPLALLRPTKAKIRLNFQSCKGESGSVVEPVSF